MQTLGQELRAMIFSEPITPYSLLPRGDVPAWKEIKHAVQCGTDLGEGDRQTSELS